MRQALLSLAAAALAVASPAARDADAYKSIVNLGYARYNGSVNSTTGVTTWNGLYYAASPEGQLRWQPPVDIEKKNNYTKGQLIDATMPGPICYQTVPAWQSPALQMFSTPSNATVSENCLLLNVRKPNAPVSSKLPVMVQIHGGGYDQGSASGPSGEFLVSQSKGQIIYVEIQYRLGGFGFLNNAEVKKSGTANAGLLDQRSALQWVQRNIGAFGGDPSKVTIIGGSAGGGSVTAQLQLFGGDAKPPFRAAIAEFPWWQNFHNDKTYGEQYNELLKYSKCSDLACLRSLPFKQLSNAVNLTVFNAYKEGRYGFGDYYFGPGVDGQVIKELPHVAYSSGRFSKVPMIVDHDALEGAIFSNSSINTEAGLLRDLEKLWPQGNKSFFDQIEKLYPTSAFNTSAYYKQPIIAATAPNQSVGMLLTAFDPNFPSVYGKNPYFYKRQQIFGDGYISCPTRTIASSLVQYGQPVWKLIFNAGALIHGAVDFDIFEPTLFPGTNMTQANQLRSYWISFATELDPNKNSLGVSRPNWQGYGTGANILQVNFTNVGNNVDEDKSERCQFFFNSGNVINS